jgi:hypothetical protein
MAKTFEVKMETNDDSYEYYTTMKVFHKGILIASESDGGEPEDNSFGRDWNFVPGLVEKAYLLGVTDGAAAATNEILKMIKET